ncbi:MAG: ABC transporter permease [Gammaproteobacteria bacterium]|nr:ABC transporter permease [Gammaproteobacteria bacterium]MDH5802001.1 ABC transporter permease [Gammaproteobacteria bacterium]
MNILSLSLRNVVRSWRRSLVTTLAMAFAGLIMILFAALMEGMLQDSERNAVSMNLGDIQIHRPGYRDDPDLYSTITDHEALLQSIRGQGLYASSRLYGFGLAAVGTASAGVQLRAIEPQYEQTVTQIHRHVLQGEWLHDSQPNGIVLGRKLSRTLGVKPGDEVVFVGQAADGSMANDVYFVRGILKSVADDVDRAGVYMLQSSYRELMVFPQGVHEIAVMRPDRSTDLQAAVAGVLALAPQQETLSWRELMPVLANILEIADSQMLVMLLITYVAVATVVLNAMLMSVFERIQEFGVMKAVGVSPWQLLRLIYAESLIQVFIAGTLAIVCGWPVAAYFQDNGIDLTAFSSGVSWGGVALEPVIRAQVSAEALLQPVLVLALVAVLAVLYPAIKAAVIQPVQAIHHR